MVELRHTVDGRSEGFTWLAIYHADENLNFETEPTMVPLEDTHIETSKGIILENDENLVVRYVLNRIPVLARIGLDGTVKDKQPLPDLFNGEEWRINGIVAYTDSPREYRILVVGHSLLHFKGEGR